MIASFSLPTAGLLALLFVAFTSAHAEQKPHTHGRMALDVAVDTQSITISMEAPLDNFLGFERAPRTEAERKQVDALVTQLNAADSLFVVNPESGCTLSNVTLQSEALGLGATKPGVMTTASSSNDNAHGAGHADIDATFLFACPHADQARFIDVELFSAFKRIASIDVQVAAKQGQFKRKLTRSTTRLAWGK